MDPTRTKLPTEEEAMTVSTGTNSKDGTNTDGNSDNR